MIGRLCSTFYVLYLVNATLPNIILIRNVLSACWIPFKAKMTSTIILDGNQQDKSSLPFLLSTFKHLKISELKVRLSTANTKKRNLGHFTMISYCWCTIAHVSSYCKMHYTSSSLWFSLQVKTEQKHPIHILLCKLWHFVMLQFLYFLGLANSKRGGNLLFQILPAQSEPQTLK